MATFGTPQINSPGSFNRNQYGIGTNQFGGGSPAYWSPSTGFGNSIPGGMYATKYSQSPGTGMQPATALGGMPTGGLFGSGFGSGSSGGGGASGGYSGGANLPSVPTSGGNISNQQGIIGNPGDFNYLPQGVVDTGINQIVGNKLERAAGPQQYFEQLGATPGNVGSARTAANVGTFVQEPTGSELDKIPRARSLTPLEAAMARYGFGSDVYKAQADEQLGLAGVNVSGQYDILQRLAQELRNREAFAQLI